MGRPNSNKIPSSSKGKRRRKSIHFSPSKKKILAESDLGSWFSEQQKLWNEEYDESNDFSASRKKIILPEENIDNLIEDSSDDSSSESGDDDVEEIYRQPNRFVIIDVKTFQQNMDMALCCRHCQSSVSLQEQAFCHHGLGTKLVFICSNKECIASGNQKISFFSTPKNEQSFKINTSLVLALRAIGKGRKSARKLLSIMNLGPTISSATWTNETRKLAEKTSEVIESNMKEAVQEVKYSKNSTKCDKTLSIGTSFDCSWNSRGWQATEGVVACITKDSGKIIDIVQKSSSCSQCSLKQTARDEGKITSIEYLEWFLNHEPNCLLNHTGSPQSMESSAVLTLYRRSVSKHNLYYDPFIGDGDSASYREVCNSQVYGDIKQVGKEEDIGHVTKRMGTQLRAIVRDYKGKKLKDGKVINGKGRLTNNRINVFQNLYGHAIRSNKGRPKSMSKAVMASLKHYCSTIEKPQHEDCPVGPTSWCSFQRDIANNTHEHKPIKNPITPAIREIIQPIFQKLGDEKFLIGCKNLATSNPNESFHHILWSMVPKEQFKLIN